MELAFSKKVYIMRNPDMNVMGFRYLEKSYIIGFAHKQMLKKASTHISPMSTMKFHNLGFQNVRPQMNAEYPEYMETVPDADVLIDTDANLVIEKQEATPLITEMLDTQEFLMYPFTKNIGIVYANNLLRETKRSLVYDVCVIAPAYATDLFEQFEQEA
jgi:hypothetical protein